MHQTPNLKCFLSHLAATFVQSIEAMYQVKNEDIVGAALTEDAPTTSEWSTSLPPGSLITLWASESLSYSHVSFNLMYNVMRERYIIQTYVDGIYKHVFRVCTIWDAQSFWLINCCGFNIQPFCSGVCGDHRRPQTLAEMCRGLGICYGFRSVAASVRYPEFM